MLTVGLFIFLIIAGIVSGIVSAVASMASLVSYPALLIAGCNPIMANITSTATLISTGPGVLLASYKKMQGHWLEFGKYCLFLLSGVILGSILLLSFPGKVFEKVVPFFILASAIALTASNKNSPGKIKKKRTKLGIIGSYIGLIIGGMYTGYFGAAAGVIHLIFINYLSDDEFFTINAMKDIVGALGNFVALIIFIFGASVDWMKAIPMAIGLFIGGYLGQYSIRFLSFKIVAWITMVFSVILAGWLFYASWKV
ncbi:putative membrane protein YfcA [Lactobacillus colini]|uniref:Probable membrane transporter protein n=1 Tax=Lactobacillus colini TaxID=1819254 RepID=A0ABS4MBT3_9LACO|nr:sulfite exporter TauE/SafE family protein [Lactobacillus colini]MBP2057144.1 putative membrane protein YfcA [Lactobacillus colini]